MDHKNIQNAGHNVTVRALNITRTLGKDAHIRAAVQYRVGGTDCSNEIISENREDALQMLLATNENLGELDSAPINSLLKLVSIIDEQTPADAPALPLYLGCSNKGVMARVHELHAKKDGSHKLLTVSANTLHEAASELLARFKKYQDAEFVCGTPGAAICKFRLSDKARQHLEAA